MGRKGKDSSGQRAASQVVGESVHTTSSDGCTTPASEEALSSLRYAERGALSSERPAKPATMAAPGAAKPRALAVAASPEENSSSLEPEAEQCPAEVRDTKDRGKVFVTLRALEPGEVVLRATPVMEISRKGQALTIEELQRWAYKFMLLDSNQRERVLAMSSQKKAAPAGALASLVGKRGEQVAELIRVPNGVTAEDLWTLFRILESSAFEVAATEESAQVVLLLLGCSMNHSCLPNALLGPGAKKGTIEVRTLRPIGAGEEVTISYIDEQSLFRPVADRRAALSRRRQFACACDRCAGPDTLRVFRCMRQTCRGSVMASASDGDGSSSSSTTLTACGTCGKVPAGHGASEVLAAEQRILDVAKEVTRTLQKTAGGLSIALAKRDGAAFAPASEAAMHALGTCANLVSSNKQVEPQHFAVAGLAKSAATLRTLMGDSLAATNRGELASKMWGAAAGELGEAIQNEYKALPLPRDGRIMDLVGVAGLLSRLAKPEAAQRYFEDALNDIRLIGWACAPSRREELESMRQGVEAALADIKSST
mmetsp:Transcript_130134/g.417590  ORF Transcript_130134/g.417590 Transcript_130134/m.417590 type:complete len:541 (+) Transcript_130134:51-1673(+)